MVTRRTLIFASVLVCGMCAAHAQVQQAWFNRFDGSVGGIDAAVDVAIDGAGNVIVTGRSSGSSGFDIVTIKYSPSGAELWRTRFDGPASGDDVPSALAIDASGDVVVVGASAGLGSGEDYVTLKYAADGALLWNARLNGPVSGADVAADVAIDSSGAVTVTGRSSGAGGFDYATVRYTSSGAQVWVARYDGPANGADVGKLIAIDGTGAVVVTGESDGGVTGQDIATVKYNSSGAQQWVRRTPSAGYDTPNGLAISANGDVHVCGEASNGFNQDYAIVKISANNLLRWSIRYNGPGNAFDSATAIAVDPSGAVYVTGTSAGLTTNLDVATLGYDADGVLQWSHRYNGTASGVDTGEAIALNDGAIYVSGASRGNGTQNDIATLRLTTAGQLVWVVRANGAANQDDAPAAIAAGPGGVIAVAGLTTGEGPDIGLATIRYTQQPPSFESVPIDLNGRYFIANGVARARTAVVAGGQVDEPTGADEATFTPFSDAAKPPRALRLNLLGRSYQYDVSLAGLTSGASASVRAGSLPSGFAQNFTVASGAVTVAQNQSAFTDATGASVFRVRVDIEPSGFATTAVTRLDGSQPGTTFLLASEPTAGLEAAAFEVQATGSGGDLGEFHIARFIATAATNALVATAADVYLRPNEPAEFRVRQYALLQPIIGYQLFFDETGPLTIEDLGGIDGYYTSAPFDSHFLDPRGVITEPGLAAGLGLPNQDHVVHDALLATLPYRPDGEGISDFRLRVDNGRSEVRSMFSDSQSREIVPSLFSPPIVLVDGVAPTLQGLTATQIQSGNDNRIDKSVQNGTLTLAIDAGDAGVAPSGLAARPTFVVQFASGVPVTLVGRHSSGKRFEASIAIDDNTPRGSATVTVLAIDDAGNERTLTGRFSVGTEPSSVTIELTVIGLGFANVVREVEFTVGGSGPGGPPIRVSKNVTFNNGAATVVLDASDGLLDGVNYTRVGAKDPRHTLRRSVDTQGAGGAKTATIAVLSGDASNDNVIDIIDYGIVASFFGQNIGRNTPIGSPPQHPDFNGNGIVQTIDVTFVTNSGQFLVGGDDEPGGLGRRINPRTKATVREMLEQGAHRAVEMDRDRDGWVTVDEIGAWLKARGA
jgi:hypothetical protein